MTTPVPDRSNDEWLAALEGTGDAGALNHLTRYIRAGLAKTLADRVNAADIDDFAQEAVVRIIEKRDRFRGESRFTTWAMAVAIRHAYTALRRKRWGEKPLSELGLPAPAVPPAASNPGYEAERNDIFHALRTAIDTVLTEKQRTVILAELQGVPAVELVRQLDTNANALYKLYHDARKKLRTALEDAGFAADDVRNQPVEAFKR